jgi:hypothetical protein
MAAIRDGGPDLRSPGPRAGAPSAGSNGTSRKRRSALRAGRRHHDGVLAEQILADLLAGLGERSLLRVTHRTHPLPAMDQVVHLGESTPVRL